MKQAVSPREYMSVLNGRGLAPLIVPKTSGAQNIIVPQNVIVAFETSVSLASPKSEIFILMLSKIRMLAGFRSLWEIYFEWR